MQLCLKTEQQHDSTKYIRDKSIQIVMFSYGKYLIYPCVWGWITSTQTEQVWKSNCTSVYVSRDRDFSFSILHPSFQSPVEYSGLCLPSMLEAELVTDIEFVSNQTRPLAPFCHLTSKLLIIIMTKTRAKRCHSNICRPWIRLACHCSKRSHSRRHWATYDGRN